ncbi:MAG: prepilin-type N-terminal cleavage/methylation domain-containing protein, partial [Candidatus Binatia bacterium]
MIYPFKRDRDRNRDSDREKELPSLSLSQISICGGFTLIELLVVMVIIGLL